jgi:opacity protein-like surface antigen
MGAIVLLALSTAAACAQQITGAVPNSAAQRLGGNHEFGGIAGYSPFSGPVWGYDQNVRYLPVVLRYSYRLTQHRFWSLRYAPELTALSVLHERAPSATNPAAPVTHFGAGFSPEGLQLDYLPARKVQPFLSNNGGFIYYADRVLSPQGSQWMYTIDFGVGVNVFVRAREAVTFGYRYQHLSNANISVHNPGTDADTFYVGYSGFHTHGVR